MKKIAIIVWLAAITIVTFGQADNKKNTGARAKTAADRLNAVVHLTKEQYTKVLDEYNTFYSKIELTYEQNAFYSPINSEERTTPFIEELADKRNNKLRAILSIDQWQKAKNARVVNE